MASQCTRDAMSRPIRMLLTAHDEDPAPQDPPVVPDVDPEPEPEPPADPPKPKDPAAKKPDDDGEPKLDKEHSEVSRREIAARQKAREAEAEARAAKAERDAALAKVQEYEDASKTELEKAQAIAERAQAAATAAREEVVATRIELAAQAADFEDPSDALDALGKDVAKFVKDGKVDAKAIEAAVAELLVKKPHWKKPDPAPAAPVREKKAPEPDPAQGPRGKAPATDLRTAPREDVDAALAEYQFRPRR